jgi:small subunit ribosomal protein S16
MLRIRLQRTGNKNNPTFRLVVTEKRNAAKGKSLERVGHYLPVRDPVVFEFDQKRIEHWIGFGAIPTDTVARLLTKAGVKGLEKYTEQYTKQKKRKEVVEEPAPAPVAAKEEKKEEAPVEEAAPAEEAKEEEKPAEEPKEEEKKEEDDNKEADA